MKNVVWAQVIERCCRFYVFIFMNFYGLAKLFGGQFYTPNRIPQEILQTTIAEISNFDLAWSFMGRSYGYLFFIGISEIVGACLLLFHKTKLLGTLLSLVILLNVIVFDIFFLDAYGALGSAVVYTLLLLIVLWINRHALSKALQELTTKLLNKREDKPRPNTFVLVLLLMALIFGVNQLIVNLLGYGKG